MKNKNGWEIKPLKNLGQIVTGNTPKTSKKDNYSSNDYCFFKPGDLRGENISILNKSENFVSKLAFEGSRILPVGSVLVTCIGTIGNVGVTTVISTSNQQINAIIPNNDVTSMFLAYSIRSLRSYLNHIANAPVVPIINKTQFSEIIIPVPPLSIQHQIVSELDTLSDIITKRKQQLDELDNLAQATFYEMFGDLVTNEKGWEIRRLDEVCDLNPKKSEISEIAGNTNVSFVPMSFVGEKGELALSENRTITEVKSGFTYFKNNDVLFAKITPCMENGKGTIAKGLTNGIGFGSTEFHVLRPKEFIISEYIYAITKKSDFRKEAEINMTGSAGQKRVPKDFLAKYKIPVPDLFYQNKFANRIESIEKQKKLINQSIAEVQQLFDYTMDKYFN